MGAEQMWSESEELAFTSLMAAGGLERLAAIRMFRRFNGDLQRALVHARERGEVKAGIAKRFKSRLQGQKGGQANAA